MMIKLIKFFITTIILIVIYFVGWTALPTICNVPEGIEWKSSFLDLFFSWYSKNPQLYIVISVVFQFLVSYGIYWIIMMTTKKEVSNVYTAAEIQKRYKVFLQDATQLYIIGGDMDFLLNCEEQKNRIVELGNRCTILFRNSEVGTQKEKLKKLYKELLDKGVRLGVYSEESGNFKNIRGQIKIGADGKKSCLVVNTNAFTNGQKQYEVLNLQNQFIIEIILKSYEELFDKSKQSLHKLILFDMGGVFFDGDFKTDFLDVINKKLSQNIKASHSQKLVLDNDLNTGNMNITQWVESKIARRLNPSESEFIEEKWKNTWSPNPKMQMLVKDLKNNGYQVGILSNMDAMNGGVYNEKGYFSEFPIQNRFLSYEHKITKPDRKIFEKVLKEHNLEPYEVLFIDDHEKNIAVANQIGMDTIQFCITDDSELTVLKKKLRDYHILISD